MDFQTFLLKLKQFSHHPAVKIFVMPLSFIMYGVALGSKINFNVFGTIVLYLFLLVMQFVEQYLFISDVKRGYIKFDNLYGLELIVGVLLIALYFLSNLIFVLLLLIYVVSVHLLYTPFRLKGSIYYLILQLFLKGFVLTIVASFMQVNLVSQTLLVHTLPIIFALLFYYGEFELLDNIKYGMSTLSDSLLKILSPIGIIGSAILPFLVGKIALSNVFGLLLLSVSTILMVLYTLKKEKYLNNNKSKNYLSTLFTVYMIVFSII